jgi:fructose-1,6-bisphosphatase
MKVPKRGSVYSVNEGNSDLWDPNVQEYIGNVKRGKGVSKKR